MYSKEELPTLIQNLPTSTDPEEIKKCCLSAAAIAQELIVKPEGEEVADIPQLLDDNLLQALVDVVKGSTDKPKVAVRNAFRALGDISKMPGAKTKLKEKGVLEGVKLFLERTADHAKNTPDKESFPYSACALLNNLIVPELLTTLIGLGYTPLLIRLMKSSVTTRPSVSVFAANVLRSFAGIDEGKLELMANEAHSHLKTVIEAAITAIDAGHSAKEDLLFVIHLCCRIISSLCENVNNVNSFAQGGYVFLLHNASRLFAPTFEAVTTSIEKSSATLNVLMNLMKTEEGGEEVNGNVDLATMYGMLQEALTMDASNADTGKALQKLTLGIGGIFTGEPDTPVTAQQFIALLNKACDVYLKTDSEVIFIVTSLIVHLSSFDGGLEALQADDTISTSAVVLGHYLKEERSEVTQSILRNVVVMLNTGCSEERVIPILASHGIFALLKEICGLHTELNSEITDTAIELLSRVATSPDGLKEISAPEYAATIKEVLNYFTTVNLSDERRDSIIAKCTQLVQALPPS
ncbi:uncharacterized protein MONOS_7801 [Monocercomonoides exilis]|uniref:uncharacterized protein n=1 Tax=Monocercomonoides exilis TaxID=2049356 RepID=UPI00355AB0C9|nr:hypothetical protein MONOS_7801 [Monocercomonoides exilis]|eukprot:MONOS_7801.1-p1 / transcript=MONOS_7801.1 / gene=MONOS_7801 / organism=Monocercomonoides_exilis_PA203 / gene_product=unspecified product / transcript_product=unspecified product / location=Mono_scaffold00276:60843-62743(+) / protein_length=523 / sequence_SO=supercontig / SO=protein_coding / is_pseudo=false